MFIFANLYGYGDGMRCFYSKCFRILMAGSLSVFALTSISLREAASQEGWYSLQALQAEIDRAISDARELADQPPYFLVKKVELELKGTKSVDPAGGFSIPVFGASIDLGVKTTTSANEVLEIALVPSDSTVVGGDAPKIDLAGLIADLKNAFRREKGKKPLFIIATVKYEKSWALQLTGNGGIKLVIASAKLSISDEKRQLVRFTLCETVNLRDCAAE
ncbi:MAG: hypothetical protein JSW39_25030 [Desulfobacterales bacterium]|nr:MAG: hypothetical protein JSW39_25030 [Desulfobacterales bacterium]